MCLNTCVLCFNPDQDLFLPYLVFTQGINPQLHLEQLIGRNAYRFFCSNYDHLNGFYSKSLFFSNNNILTYMYFEKKIYNAVMYSYTFLYSLVFGNRHLLCASLLVNPAFVKRKLGLCNRSASSAVS